MDMIKGSRYQFAGVDMRKVEKTGHLSLSAVFCGANENPNAARNLSFAEFETARTLYTALGAGALMKAIVSHDEYTGSRVTDETDTNVRELSIDLGPDRLRQVMNLMSTVSTATIPDCESVFIPAARLRPAPVPK